MTDYVIEARNLTKRYRKVVALDQLSLDVEAGSISMQLATIGRSSRAAAWAE